MKNIFYLILLIFNLQISISLNATNFDIIPPKIDINKIISANQIDNNAIIAGGLILDKKEKITINKNYISKEVYVLARIFNERGIEFLGNIKIEFNPNFSEIIVDKERTRTYNNKKWINISDHMINTKIADRIQNYQIYLSDLKELNIILPNLKNNSIIEYHYIEKIKKASYPLNKYYDTIYLQDYFPIKSFELEIKYNEDLNYSPILLTEYEINKSDNEKIISIIGKNIPQIIYEYSGINIREYTSRVELSEIQDWESFADWFLEKFQFNLIEKQNLDLLVQRVKLGESIEEKKKNIKLFFDKNFYFADIPLSLRNYKNKTVFQILQNMGGDQIDEGIIYYYFLDYAGLNPEILLVDNPYRKMSDIVNPDRFNVLVFRVGKDYFSPYLPLSDFGYIAEINNVNAYNLNTKSFERIQIENKDIITIKGNFDINKKLLLTGEYTIELNGKFAQNMRNKLLNLVDKKSFFEDMVYYLTSSGKLKKFFISDIYDTNNPLKIIFSFDLEDLLISERNIKVFDFRNFLLEKYIIEFNKYLNEDILYGKLNEEYGEINYRFKFKFDKNYNIIYYPESFLIPNKIIQYKISSRQNKELNEVIYNLSIKSDTYIISKENYKEMKKNQNKIFDDKNFLILLK